MGQPPYGFGAKGMRLPRKTVVFAIWRLLLETPSSGQMPCGPCQRMCVPRVARDVCSREGRILERLPSPGWPPALLMLTLPGAASGTLGEPCQPRFLGSGQTPERMHVFLSFPPCGLWTHAATDVVLGRKMEKIPSQREGVKRLERWFSS